MIAKAKLTPIRKRLRFEDVDAKQFTRSHHERQASEGKMAVAP
jgi:hypothetical protein